MRRCPLISCGGWRCVRCSGSLAPAPTRRKGSGEIGLAFTTAAAADISNQGLNTYFAAAYEAAHEAVYNCLVAARPAERLDGSRQDEFPIEAVRRRA